MPSNRASALGSNLILTSFLAALSYFPFEYIAKITLLVCFLLFIIDPYPGSRIVSFVAVGAVLIINRVRQRFEGLQEEQQEGLEDTTTKDKSE